jgi:hypothetical protein
VGEEALAGRRDGTLTVALRGKGALAIWNGIAAGADAEFIEWHVKEHMPERVALPGFLCGRRYSAIDGTPAYFNFYEVSEPAVLRSDSYLARLNDPSPWTRRIVANFTETSRTLCRIAASAGVGVAAFAEVVRFGVVKDAGAACAAIWSLTSIDGISAAHLFLRDDGPAQVTSETRLRSAPDTTWAAVLIVESATSQAAAAARSGPLSDEALLKAGLGRPAGRGLYRLDYLINHEDAVTAAASNRPIHEGSLA